MPTTPPSPRSLALGWAVLRAGSHRWVRRLTWALGVVLFLLSLPILGEAASLPVAITAGLLAAMAVFGALVLLACVPDWMAILVCRHTAPTDPLHRLLRPHPGDAPPDAERSAHLRTLLDADLDAMAALLYTHLEQGPDHHHPQDGPLHGRILLRDCWFQTRRTPARTFYIAPTHTHHALLRELYQATARRHGVPTALALCGTCVPLNSPAAPTAHQRLRARATALPG